MTDKLKVGVIGAGKMGELHLQKYRSIPTVDLLGFFEPNEKRAVQVAEIYETKAFSNLSEFLFEVDAVSVASTTTTHFANCRAALEAGVNVLVEKPMCDDIEQAAELIRISEKQGLVLQVGYLERFRFERLAAMIPRETVRLIEARWCATTLPRESSLDVVADMLVHPLDMVLSLTHEEPEDIQVSGFSLLTSLTDVFEARLTFPSGLIANLIVNRVAQHRERRVTLYSSQRIATLNFLTNHIEMVRNREGALERSSFESTGSDGDVLRMQVADFVDAVQGSRRPVVSAEDGLRVLKTLARIREAAHSVKPFTRASDLAKDIHVS